MEVINPAKSTMHYWYLKLVPLALVVLSAFLYFETTKALYERWVKWDESLSHGLIIIGLFLYFLFTASPLTTSKDKPLIRIFFLICLGAASLTWYLANLINIYIVEQLALLAVIICLLTAVFGQRFLQQHFKLLLLPIFAIPIWDQLTDPLVNLSGLIVGKLVRLIELPAVIDSNSIFIPYGEIVIADGCSGLRYLTISLAIAYIISYLNGYSLKKLCLSLIIATLIGLMANWVRIFILVIVGYETQMKSSLMSDHEYFGWALFALILFPAIYLAPVIKRESETRNRNEPLKPKLVAALIFLILGPLINFTWGATSLATEIVSKIPHEFSPITRSKMPVKVELAAGSKTENALTSDGVFIQVNHFQRKSEDDKLVPYIPRMYDHVVWSVINRQKSNNSESINIQIFRNKHNGIIVAQAQWFDVADMVTSSYAVAKLLQIPAIIRGKNSFRVNTLQSVCETTNCYEAIIRIENARKTLI